jgi:hypothetical protein
MANQASMILEVITSTQIPTRYVGGIPNVGAYNGIIKDVTAYVTLSGSSLPTSGWLVVDIPRKNALFYATPLTGTFATTAFYEISNTSFTQISSTPVPTTTVLALNPDVTDQMVMTRWAAGVFRMFANTISTTNSTLSGTLAGCALTTLNALGSNWGFSNMVQVAMVPKDGKAGVQAFEGITALIGCDVLPEYTPAEFNSAVVTRGAGTVGYSTNISNSTTTATPAQVYWFSDYSTLSCTTTGVQVFNRATGIPFPNNQAPTSFKVQFVPPVTSAGTNYVSVTIVLAQQAMGPTPSVPVTFAGPSTTYELTSITPQVIEVALDAWLTTSYVYGYCISFQFSAAAGATTAPVIQTANISVFDSLTSLTSGSVRVLAWDNLTANQALTISAMVQVEGSPTGTLVPYLRGNVNVGYGDPQMLPLLHGIYTSPHTEFCRIREGKGEVRVSYDDKSAVLTGIMEAAMKDKRLFWAIKQVADFTDFVQAYMTGMGQGFKRASGANITEVEEVNVVYPLSGQNPLLLAGPLPNGGYTPSYAGERPVQVRRIGDAY